MADDQPAAGSFYSVDQVPPVADLPKPPQFEPGLPNPPVFEPPKLPSQMQGPPAFEPPKFAIPSPQTNPPQFNPPPFEPPKMNLPPYVPPELRGSDSAPKVVPQKAGLPQPMPFKPVFQPPPGVTFPINDSPKIGGPPAGFPPSGGPSGALPSQDPPQFQPVQKPNPAASQGQSPAFKPATGMPSFIPPQKSQAPSEKPGLPVQSSPWIAAPSKPEENKDASKPAKFAFKSGIQTPVQASHVTPEVSRPRGLLGLIRERACLRPEEPNEWECPACHLFNSIEFIQCETCMGENKVLAGVLQALEMPGKKREKGVVEKKVEQLKSWIGW